MRNTKRKKRDASVLSWQKIFVIPMLYAIAILALLSCAAAYFMTVKTVPDSIVAAITAVLLASFAFSYVFFVCRRCQKKKGVFAGIALLIVLILFLSSKLFFPVAVFDTSFLLKICAIVIGGIIGLFLSSSYGKKKR